jgi:hypothetical protein
MNVEVFRSLSSFALACVLPVILAAGSCLSCFAIVSRTPAGMCCKHRNQCQERAAHPDCLGQVPDPGQAQPAGSITAAQAAQAAPALVAEPLAPVARPVFRVLSPPSGQASPPGLFVLHSCLLI